MVAPMANSPAGAPPPPEPPEAAGPAPPPVAGEPPRLAPPQAVITRSAAANTTPSIRCRTLPTPFAQAFLRSAADLAERRRQRSTQEALSRVPLPYSFGRSSQG